MRVELGVASPVALECSAARVERVAVDLDDEAVGGPEEVDLVAGDPHVGLGLGQAGRADELEEAAFGF